MILEPFELVFVALLAFIYYASVLLCYFGDGFSQSGSNNALAELDASAKYFGSTDRADSVRFLFRPVGNVPIWQEG